MHFFLNRYSVTCFISEKQKKKNKIKCNFITFFFPKSVTNVPNSVGNKTER